MINDFKEDINSGPRNRKSATWIENSSKETSSKQIIVIKINYNKPVGTITNRLNQAEESTQGLKTKSRSRVHLEMS